MKTLEVYTHNGIESGEILVKSTSEDVLTEKFVEIILKNEVTVYSAHIVDEKGERTKVYPLNN